MFMVKYVDDFHKKHLVFVKNLRELKYVQERFEVIEYTPVNQIVEVAF